MAISVEIDSSNIEFVYGSVKLIFLIRNRDSLTQAVFHQNSLIVISS